MPKTGKPNILFLMADDIGWFNLSCYNHRPFIGLSLPNIDRIAREGAMFTDFYGQQSCIAGRAALRIPKMFASNAMPDPFEARRGQQYPKYNDWFVEHVPFASNAAQENGRNATSGSKSFTRSSRREGGKLHRRSDRRREAGNAREAEWALAPGDAPLGVLMKSSRRLAQKGREMGSGIPTARTT